MSFDFTLVSLRAHLISLLVHFDFIWFHFDFACSLPVKGGRVWGDGGAAWGLQGVGVCT